MKNHGKKKPNWRRIRMRGKTSPGKADYEAVYLKNDGWKCVVGRVGEKRQELGPYATEAEAKAEAETWRAMRLISRPSEPKTKQAMPLSEPGTAADAQGLF